MDFWPALILLGLGLLALLGPWYSISMGGYFTEYYTSQTLWTSPITSLPILFTSKTLNPAYNVLLDYKDIQEATKITAIMAPIYIIILITHVIGIGRENRKIKGIAQTLYIIPPILYPILIILKLGPQYLYWHADTMIGINARIGIDLGYAAAILLGITGVYYGYKNLTYKPPWLVIDYRKC